MPTFLPNTGMQLPVRGSAGASLWADTLDANLQIIDTMDHTPGHGPRIPTAGMSINADLPFSSLYAPTQLHRAQFSAIAGGAMTNLMNKSLFVSDGTSGLSTNELYWRTTSGASVKLTSGSSLNIAGFAGGISGDFTATGAIVSYDDAAKRYLFKEGTLESNNWARVYCGGIRLAQFNTNESLYVELLAPDALAAQYAITWPLAVPAATHPLQMTSGGVLVETGSVAMATDESVTVSGTGEFKHGSMTLQIAPQSGTALEANWVNDPVGGNFKNSVGNGRLVVSIPLKAGDRITGARFLLLGDGAADVTATLFANDVAMAQTTMATLTVTNQVASWAVKTMTVTAKTLAVDECAYLVFLSSATGLQLGNITITFTRP